SGVPATSRRGARSPRGWSRCPTGGFAVRILLPGGAGQVGTILARAFHSDGHEVVVLSRAPQKAPWLVVAWDANTPGPWTRRRGGEAPNAQGGAARGRRDGPRPGRRVRPAAAPGALRPRRAGRPRPAVRLVDP